MMGRTHKIVSGSSAFLTVAFAGAPPALAVAAGGVAALSAPLPDVDQRVSFLPHRGPTHWPTLQALVFSLPVISAALWLPTAPLALSFPIIDLTIEFPPVWAMLAALCFAAWFGCLMHSVADAMTIERHGIALLWPISRRGYHVLPRSMRVRVASDSRSERAFVAIWCIIVVCLVYLRFRQQIPA